MLLSLAIRLIVGFGICAILWWGYSRIEPRLPEPLKVVAIVFVMILAIALLLWVAGMLGGGFVRIP